MTWLLIRDWLKHCDSHHDCYSHISKEPLPSRLIRISSREPSRLVVTDDSTPPARYATLSHCWGSLRPLRLLSTNFEDMQAEIPLSQLTKTFQHAIIACQRLEIEYLWIDSLCIIQDSAEDWRRQSATMARVYSNSYCNLFAAHARDGTFGCFTTREPRAMQPTKVFLDWGAEGGQHHYVVPELYWDETMFQTPLNRRAWVFQERTLAPRNLIFGPAEVFFECRAALASELFPRGLPPRVGPMYAFRGVRPDVDGSRAKLRRREGRVAASGQDDVTLKGLAAFDLWHVMVIRYSTADLTYQSDKLVALSAIASEMHRHIKADFLAGLWRRYLPYQLLWAVDPPNSATLTTSVTARSATTTGYVAPSWSWAKSIAAVEGVCDVHHVDERDVLVEILEASTDLVSDDAPFGQVTGGVIRIRGHLAKGVPVRVPHLDSEVLRLPFARSGNDTSNNYMHFDVPTTLAGMDGRELYFLPVRHALRLEAGLSNVYGLVLRRASRLEGEYERLGVFCEAEDPMYIQSACRRYAAQELGLGLEAQGWGFTQDLCIR
jgi:hypothetical protein